MAKLKTVIVKFSALVGTASQSEKIRKLVGNNVIKVQQLFPGEKEEDLASLFEVVLDEKSSVESVLSTLCNDESIEYAHTPEERQPI